MRVLHSLVLLIPRSYSEYTHLVYSPSACLLRTRIFPASPTTLVTLGTIDLPDSSLHSSRIAIYMFCLAACSTLRAVLLTSLL